MEKRHLHPLLQFLYPSAISNAIAEIRCIRFLPAADGTGGDLASQIETSRVLPSLSSICQSSHDLTLHCLECISLPECILVFQQSSKVLLGNCLGVVCVIKWQCLKSTFEWQCLKPETCSLETDPSFLPKARAAYFLQCGLTKSDSPTDLKVTSLRGLETWLGVTYMLPTCTVYSVEIRHSCSWAILYTESIIRIVMCTVEIRPSYYYRL